MVELPDFVARSRAAVDVSWLSVPLGVVAAGVLAAYAPLPADAAAMLAITAFCICLWMGTPVPPWFTGLVGVGLIGAMFSTDLALVGFRSAATWLVVLGIVLGEATRRSGLSDLVERRIFERMPAHARSDPTTAYRYLLGTFSLVGLAFVVFVPSALVRVLILGPILVSAGKCFSSRRARVGLFLGPLFVTFYGGTGVLTGTLANVIIAGLLESVAGVSVGWVEWSAWMAPVMSVGRASAAVAVAYALYRPVDSGTVSVPGATGDADANANGDAGSAYRMLGFLFVGVVVWATDSVHGLHPMYGALLVTVLALLPRVGVVDVDAVADADFSVVFFLGAIFAVAEGLQRTGFTTLAAERVLAVVPDGASLAVVLAAVAAVSLLLSFVMEGMAVASVLTPILVPFAQNAGMPLVPVAMIESVALVSYVFPYQSAVLVGILGIGMVDSRELVRMAALCTLATLAVLLPVQIAVFALLF